MITLPPDLAVEHRRRLVSSVECPRRSPDVSASAAILWILAALVTVSLVLVGASLADDIRATRAAAERCAR